MFQWILKKIRKNNKGFTLVELIVVIAILGILGGIAVPRFSKIQDQSRIKADAATAAQLISSARMQEIERNDGEVTKVGDDKNWNDNYMEWAIPQSGGEFQLSGGLDDKYEITWTPTKGKIIQDQTVTEGKEFTIKEEQ